MERPNNGRREILDFVTEKLYSDPTLDDKETGKWPFPIASHSRHKWKREIGWPCSWWRDPCRGSTCLSRCSSIVGTSSKRIRYRLIGYSQPCQRGGCNTRRPGGKRGKRRGTYTWEHQWTVSLIGTYRRIHRESWCSRERRYISRTRLSAWTTCCASDGTTLLRSQLIDSLKFVADEFRFVSAGRLSAL